MEYQQVNMTKQQLGHQIHMVTSNYICLFDSDCRCPVMQNCVVWTHVEPCGAIYTLEKKWSQYSSFPQEMIILV